MAYTAEKPKNGPSTSLLRATIPGWGVDLDRKSRPAVPKERFAPESTGAHWDFPERQIAQYRRERSPEHKFLTPVFGTVCPPKGVSGLIRRYAYRLSEGRTSHWVLLMLADRVDVLESRFGALLRGRPDNLIAEAGLKAEVTRHGLRSRIGQRRADVKHLPIDVALFLGTGVATVAAAYAVGRAYTKSRRRPLLARLGARLLRQF